MSVLDVQWKQKDGTLIAVSEMDTNHVENALRMMERELENYRDTAKIVNRQTNPEVVAKYEWWIRTFKAELKRRNLCPDSSMPVSAPERPLPNIFGK